MGILSLGRQCRAAAAFAVLLALTTHIAAVAAVQIQSGKQYYIILDKSTYCSGDVQYLGFNNKTCSAGTTGGTWGPTVGPLLRGQGDSTQWKRWTIKIKEREGNNLIVTISNYWSPSSSKQPQCLGQIAVEKPSQCNTGTYVDKVRVKPSSQTWRLVPIDSDSFQIITTTRGTNCLRYLGASSNCNDKYAKLYKKDDRSGLQRWVITPTQPVPPTPPSPSTRPPGKPVIVGDILVTSSTWIANWLDSTAGIPTETYSLKCTSAGASSCKSGAVGSVVSGIKRGVQRGIVTDLPSDTNLKCYVIASNSAGTVCSDPLRLRTLPDTPTSIAPGAPTGVSNTVTGNTWQARWTDGSRGIPVETYEAFCVNFGDSCGAGRVGNSRTDIPRGVQAADVTGLPNGRFYCYIMASNDADDVCSNPVTINVANTPAGKPSSLSGSLTGTQWSVNWRDGSKGDPTETYTVKCVTFPQGCDAPSVGNQQSNIPRGTQFGQVSNLPLLTNFNCYVIAINNAATVCSDAQFVNTNQFPAGKPTVINTVPQPTSVSLYWFDGTVGSPQETYNVKCVAWPLGCDAPASGVQDVKIPRGEQAGTATGLAPLTRYNCFVVAVNLAGATCSNAQGVTTLSNLVAPGKPTNFGIASIPGALTSNSVRVRWTDGSQARLLCSPGVPTESYTVKCFRAVLGGTPSCTDSNTVGTTPQVARGVQSATVQSLSPSTDYVCYVLAQNPATTLPVCSDPLSITTLVAPNSPPGTPTNLRTYPLPGSLTSVSWRATWTDGTPGNPTETYTLKCFEVLLGSVNRCTDLNSVGTTPTVSRGVQDATVQGLSPSTVYTCFVLAQNPATTLPVCSVGVRITTPPSPIQTPPGQPTNLRSFPVANALTARTWRATWNEGTAGSPIETYTVKCFVDTTAPCTSINNSGTAPTVPRGVRDALVTGLTPSTLYSCFVLAQNAATPTPVCSSAYLIFTNAF